MVWAPDYTTTADLAAYLRISDSADDVQLAHAISAASRAIDRHTNRQFGQVAVAEERFYTATYDRRRAQWVVDIDDLMVMPTEVVADNSGDGTYEVVIDRIVLEPRNAIAKGSPWTRLVVATNSAGQPREEPDGVRVTAQWGWTAVPEPIEQATLLQASRLFTRRDAPFGVAGSPETGSEMRLLAKVDPDVAVTLGPYLRWWGAV